MLEWWGPVIWETYGGMEGPATIAKPYRWLEKPGTVGRAIRGTRLAILDDDGRELGPGEIGGIYYGSDAPSFEYVGDAETTRAAYRGRLFTIGDVGYLDDDGYLFVCDRAKDMIITGGVNVYPQEVEAVLATHPAVGDVAVIGRARRRMGRVDRRGRATGRRRGARRRARRRAARGSAGRSWRNSSAPAGSSSGRRSRAPTPASSPSARCATSTPRQPS